MLRALKTLITDHLKPKNPKDTVRAEVGWLVKHAIPEVATRNYTGPSMRNHEEVIKAALGEMARDGEVTIEMDGNNLVMISLSENEINSFAPTSDLYRQAMIEARVKRLESEMKSMKEAVGRCATRPW